MAAFFLPCLCFLLFAVLSSYVKQLITDARRHLPPGPWPLPIIGNILHVSNKLPHRALARLADSHGELMTVRLGTSLSVVASSPSAAREVLQTHNASLSGRSPADAWSGGGHGASSVFVLQPGRRWRTLRRLGTEHMFSPGRLQETLALRRDVVTGLLRDVSEAAAASGSGGAPAHVSVRRAAFTAMVRLLWRVMFSDDDELGEAESKGLQDSVREAIMLVMTPNVSDLFPAVAAADLQGVRRRMAALIRKAYQLMDPRIERRMRARGSGGGDARRNDLLDAMLDMSEQDDDDGGGATINRDVIRAFYTVSR
jgi:cytochrome P450